MEPRDKSFYCLMVEDECVGSKCAYASCVRGRLLSGGLCGFNVKRKTSFLDEVPEEEPELKKAKVKLPRKISDEDLLL